MQIRDSYDFKKIIIESESYDEAFDKGRMEQKGELNELLDELIPTERRTPYDFERAYIIYRRNLLIKEFKEEMRKIKELLVDMDYKHHALLKDINNKEFMCGI